MTVWEVLGEKHLADLIGGRVNVFSAGSGDLFREAGELPFAFGMTRT